MDNEDPLTLARRRLVGEQYRQTAKQLSEIERELEKRTSAVDYFVELARQHETQLDILVSNRDFKNPLDRAVAICRVVEDAMHYLDNNWSCLGWAIPNPLVEDFNALAFRTGWVNYKFHFGETKPLFGPGHEVLVTSAGEDVMNKYLETQGYPSNIKKRSDFEAARNRD